MALANETLAGDWEEIKLQYQRKEGERRVRVRFEHIDAMTGEKHWDTAYIENAGMYPQDDHERMLWELRRVYLQIHWNEYNLTTNRRPDTDQFKTEPRYAWLRSFHLPESIFYS